MPLLARQEKGPHHASEDIIYCYSILRRTRVLLNTSIIIINRIL